MTTLTAVRTSRRPAGWHDYLFQPWLIPALAGLVIWSVSASLLDSTVVPTPQDAWHGIGADLASERVRTNLYQTLRVLTIAYLAAASIGAITGMLLGLSAFWSKAVVPLVYVVNSMPKVVLFPLFLLFLGLGPQSAGAFAFLAGWLAMFLIAVESTASVSRLHLKLAASLGMTRLNVIRKIVVPTAVPSIAGGLRITFGLTFLALIIAELSGGVGGFGSELLRNVSLVRMERIGGEVILTSIIALVPTLALQWIERRIQSRYGATE